MPWSESTNGIWEQVKEKIRDLAKFPIIGLVIVTAGCAAWLGFWLVWRFSEWVFVKFLEESWVP